MPIESTSVLERIAQSTRARVAATQKEIPLSILQSQLFESAKDLHIPSDFKAAFKQDYSVIAEVKLASPSKGLIAPDLDPVNVAGQYLQNGAQALSVLTEPEYFKGDLAYLAAIRQAYPQARLLMKDFILDPYQLYQGRLAGADACLLIVAMLSRADLQALYQQARELSLTPLVEVHNAQEMQIALELGADLIGVNNRNLKTLEIDLQTSRLLAQHLPAGITLICESGLSTGHDLNAAKSWGYHGFLIGSHLMASGQPGAALAALLAEAEQTRG
ncbi:MAG: indole-3-glycerol phosphate synthase TrpC [Candidatus Sericytochromatia bacterium]